MVPPRRSAHAPQIERARMSREERGAGSGIGPAYDRRGKAGTAPRFRLVGVHRETFVIAASRVATWCVSPPRLRPVQRSYMSKTRAVWAGTVGCRLLGGAQALKRTPPTYSPSVSCG